MFCNKRDVIYDGIPMNGFEIEMENERLNINKKMV